MYIKITILDVHINNRFHGFVVHGCIHKKKSSPETMVFFSWISTVCIYILISNISDACPMSRIHPNTTMNVTYIGKFYPMVFPCYLNHQFGNLAKNTSWVSPHLGYRISEEKILLQFRLIFTIIVVEAKNHFLNLDHFR